MKIRHLALAFLLNAAAFSSIYARVNVLLYHDVGKKASMFCQEKKNFEEQLKWLKENYSLVKLSELTPDSTYQVVLTFDGAAGNFSKTIFPILKKYGIKADAYIVFNEIGNNEREWNDLKKIADDNLIEFGSHSMTHKHINNLGFYAQDYELSGSKTLLEEKLNIKIDSFAWPYGDYTKKLIEYGKKAGYEKFLTTNSMHSYWPDEIGRITINGCWDFNKFIRAIRKRMR